MFGVAQSAIGTTTAVDNASLTLEATSTSGIPLVIRRFATQISNLLNVITEAGQSLFAITSDGNVGVGTSTPYAKLSVVGEIVAGYRYFFVLNNQVGEKQKNGIAGNLSLFRLHHPLLVTESAGAGRRMIAVPVGPSCHF